MKKILLLLTIAFHICNAAPTLNIALQTDNPCADSPAITWTISSDDSRIKSYVILIKGIDEKFDYNQANNIQGGPGIDIMTKLPCSGNIFRIFYNIPAETKILPRDWKTNSTIVELKPYQVFFCNRSCRYECTVHAIDIILDQEKIKTFDDLRSQINGHIIATGSTVPPLLN